MTLWTETLWLTVIKCVNVFFSNQKATFTIYITNIKDMCKPPSPFSSN